MLQFIFYFLALMNPFALFIYLLPLNKSLSLRSYVWILVRASIISYLIYAFFAVSGEAFFTRVLQIDFDSFRIFGGLVLVGFALSFILQGKESMIRTRGELDKIAAEVALPFMVGAGTITLSIIIGLRLGAALSLLTILIVMILNLAIVVALAGFRHKLKKKRQVVMDKNLEIFLRLNGFIVGAFGVDLIVTGIKNLQSGTDTVGRIIS